MSPVNVSFRLLHAHAATATCSPVRHGLTPIVHAAKIIHSNASRRATRCASTDLRPYPANPAADAAAGVRSSGAACGHWRLLDVSPVQSTKAEKVDRSTFPIDERLKGRIIDGDRDGLTDDLDEAMTGGMPPLNIINDVLLDGMKVVGELFGSGQMQLPFVLQSAETMKAAVAYLEPHMDRSDGSSSKGKLVIARSRATSTTSARTSSTSSPPTTATRCTTSASRCRSPTWSPRSRRSTPTPSG